MGKLTLQKCFRPEIENGALFIPTERRYRAGDEVFMQIWLDDPSASDDVGFDVKFPPETGGRVVRADEPMPVGGKIISCGFVGPSLEQGIVVQFLPIDSGNTRRRILRLLATPPETP